MERVAIFIRTSCHGNPSGVTLCVTEPVFTGYNRRDSNLTSSKFHPTPISTKFPFLMSTDETSNGELNEINGDLSLRNGFPVPSHKVETRPKPRQNMSKMPKKPPQKTRFTCDADNMGSRNSIKSLAAMQTNSVVT